MPNQSINPTPNIGLWFSATFVAARVISPIAGASWKKVHMSKQFVDEEWLRSYLNTEIHRYEECAPCQFGGIMRLRGTDGSGCNWSSPYLRSSGQPSEVCLPFAQRVVAEAMKKFNLRAGVCDSSQASGVGCTETIGMQPRMLNIILQIDTNLINARGQLGSVNQLECWSENGVILIEMSSTAHMEAQAGNDQRRTRKANQQIFTMTSPSPNDSPLFKKVELSLFSEGAKDENQINDVMIVCEAAKYQAILVTGDGASKRQPGGILGNRDKLNGFVRIMTPDEAVDFVHSKITERDDFNRRVAMEIGGELPSWTGRD
ncbi:MAG: hypothetical protein WA133_10575 [Syntrophales bacterium]